jgi:hypothetical protein
MALFRIFFLDNFTSRVITFQVVIPPAAHGCGGPRQLC